MMDRRLFVFGAGAAMCLAGCSSFVPKGATSPAGATRDVVLEKINEVRAANGNGLKPLHYDVRLEAAARRQAELMAARDRVAHDLGVGLKQRVNEAGYFQSVGENLAGGQQTLEQAIAGWLKSSSHRATMLSPIYTEFGFAVVTRPNTKWRVFWATIYGGPTEGYFKTP